MNVLSVCNGISCGRVATSRTNLKVDNYFSSEIEPGPIKIADKNYPQDIKNKLGDMTRWKEWHLPKIDLLIGGTPCQGLSIANKNKKELLDIRSRLVYDYVDIKNYYNPKYFLLENVKMNKESEYIISEMLGVQPIEINSNLVSAQTRKRLYWTNIPNVDKLQEKNIKLEYIIENGFTEKEKAFCLTATYYNACVQNYFIKSERQLIFKEPISVEKIRGGKLYIVGNEKIDIYPGKGADFNRENLNKLKKYVRKLTPIECERLQTLPDNYTEGLSIAERCKSIGNGWTVDVIAHILKNIPNS